MPKRPTLALLLATLSVLSMPGCDDDEPPQGALNVSGASGSLQVSCSVSPTSGTVPLTVSLTSRVQGNTPSYSLVVDYGDGTSGAVGNATHTYATPGTYAIRVAASAEGQTADCRQSVTALPPPEVADLLPTLLLGVNPDPPIGPAPLAVNFNMCQSHDPEGQRLQFRFSFGDGRETGWGSDCGKPNTYAAGAYTGFFCVTDGTPGHDVCRAVDVTAQ